VRFLHQHNEAACVATTRDFLKLHADKLGLAFELTIPDSKLGAETKAFVRAYEKTGVSVGFNTTDCEIRNFDGINVRLIKSADLQEISLVGATRPFW
jgi:HK97 family phage prohead protease